MLQKLRRGPRGDGGAVAVEAALVTPLILLMVFGIIEFTLLLKDNIAVSSAVRAGARTASAEPRYENFMLDTAAQMDRAVTTLSDEGLIADGAEMWIYKANSSGFPGNATTAPGVCGNDCVVFKFNKTTQMFEAPDSALTDWNPSNINACPKDPALNPSGPDAVGVYLFYRHSFLTGMFGDGMLLADRSVLNFEPVPPTQGCK